MTYEIPVTRARAELAELINRVVYGGERVVVTRHGRPLVALVSAADLKRLEEAGPAAHHRDGEESEGAEAAEEHVVRTVSTLDSHSATSVQPGRFGLTARHQGPGGTS